MEPAAGHMHSAIRQEQFRMTIGCRRLELTGKFLEAGGNRNLPAQAAQAIAQEVLEAGQRQTAQLSHAR